MIHCNTLSVFYRHYISSVASLNIFYKIVHYSHPNMLTQFSLKFGLYHNWKYVLYEKLYYINLCWDPAPVDVFYINSKTSKVTLKSTYILIHLYPNKPHKQNILGSIVISTIKVLFAHWDAIVDIRFHSPVLTVDDFVV